jgi:hypothetical protein
MTATVTTHLDPAITVLVAALLDLPVNTMMTVVTMGNPHHSDTATMTVMTVDHRLKATVTHLDSSTTTTVKVPTTVVPHLDPILLDTALEATTVHGTVKTSMSSSSFKFGVPHHDRDSQEGS